MANVSVSGAVSGVDTASLVTSLVQAQAGQQTLLKNQQKAQQTASDTLARISAAVTATGGLAATLAKTSTWTGATATSTSSAVTATATGTANGSLTFDVTGLAAAHALVSAETVTSTGASVASSGTVTLTSSDGSTTDIDVGGGSLAEVVAGLNAAGKGLVATAVQVSPGQYKLQVAAGRTGSTSQFSLTGIDGFTDMPVLTQGADAAIKIGSNPDTAYTITSASNTFTDLVPGMSFTVNKLDTGVTVRSTVDGTPVAGQVSKLVDAVNGLLSQITAATAWNASTKTAGPLSGDNTVRDLQSRLLDMVSGAGAPGVRLTRDGTVTFDQAAFLSAFSADPAKVAGAFGAKVTLTPAAGVAGTASLSSSTSATKPGTYAMTVTQRASREQWTVPANTYGTGSAIVVTRGSVTAQYTVGASDTTADVALGISKQASAAGLDVGAADDGFGNLVFTAAAAGSAGAFTADVDYLGYGRQNTAGQDTAGTIDGAAALGVGDVLTLASGTSGAVGLAVDVSRITDADIATSKGAVGSVTYTPGLASALDALTQSVTSTRGGSLASAAQSRTDRIKQLQTQIDDWDTRLADYRTMLTRQFTAMETAIASLKSQTSSIASLINSSGSGSTSSS
ncbi:MAG TPA: flagellar filament capping protein FliD [Kineosporiaceae bacterium]|nr:flagellar filament capping protein FliD [Kineosporiaceae bacterium]